MRQLIPALLFFLLSAVPTFAACGRDTVEVDGSPSELAMVCDSLGQVERYFAEMGYAETPRLHVVFEETVRSGEGGGRAVTGLFHADTGLIEVTSPDSKAPARATHWHQPWTPSLAASIVTHEIVHAFVAGAGPELPVAWGEFVAYAVQFTLMDAQLRAAILGSYTGAVPFEDRSEICEMVYVFDHDLFAVRSYLTAEAHGGSSYIHAIIDGAYDTSLPRRYECPAA